MDSKLVFKFKPDTDMDTKLKIHIDITVATPCSSKFCSIEQLVKIVKRQFSHVFCLRLDIGADILDSTNQNVFSFGVLEEQDTWSVGLTSEFFHQSLTLNQIIFYFALGGSCVPSSEHTLSTRNI